MSLILGHVLLTPKRSGCENNWVFSHGRRVDWAQLDSCHLGFPGVVAVHGKWSRHVEHGVCTHVPPNAPAGVAGTAEDGRHLPQGAWRPASLGFLTTEQTQASGLAAD